MIAPSYTFASTQSNVAPQQLAGVDLAFVGGVGSRSWISHHRCTQKRFGCYFRLTV